MHVHAHTHTHTPETTVTIIILTQIYGFFPTKFQVITIKLPCKPPLRQYASHQFYALDLHQLQAEIEPYPNGLKNKVKELTIN